MTLELCNTYYYYSEKITSKAFYHISVKTNCLFLKIKKTNQQSWSKFYSWKIFLSQVVV